MVEIELFCYHFLRKMFKDLAASVIFVDVSFMTVDIVLKYTCIIIYLARA